MRTAVAWVVRFFSGTSISRLRSVAWLQLFLYSWGLLGCSTSNPGSARPQLTAQTVVRQYIAYGTHQCQSQTSIGHTCSVTALVTDCNQAYYSLKNDDCCPTTKEKGTSISFKLDSCGIFAQPKKE